MRRNLNFQVHFSPISKFLHDTDFKKFLAYVFSGRKFDRRLLHSIGLGPSKVGQSLSGSKTSRGLSDRGQITKGQHRKTSIS